jgi:8-oxo-dGTP pyrophosphatase MutT (NUDIX family)
MAGIPRSNANTDNLVGGGLASGLPSENAVKECWEEAGIDEDIASQLCPTGCVSFWYALEGWTAHTEYTYDLRLPDKFVPAPNDGEVESFYKLDMQQVRQALLNGEFTPEASAVVIDYMIRHGHIDPDTEPVIEIMENIHVVFPFPYPTHKSE